MFLRKHPQAIFKKLSQEPFTGSYQEAFKKPPSNSQEAFKKV